ncbi:hypothetical protein BJ508DRAFT_327764 [Ascobolus immersus RN42]|uniref:Uncharacterized protein n=1 Tax=Ascobolus immersus RN42 TaxID=1160509 RepID=A0A3N4I281_ASCIM|nr:hypothetical protein BJ508DRAFT_327764 [Ascobolus immersus RN42]
MSLRPEQIAAAIVASSSLQELLPRFHLPDVHMEMIGSLGVSTQAMQSFLGAYAPEGRRPKSCRLDGNELGLIQGLFLALKNNVAIHRSRRADLLFSLRLSPSASSVLDNILSSVPVIYLKRLKTPCPPLRHWIYEDAVHRQRYEDWLATNPWTPDKRIKTRHYPFYFVDPTDNNLQLDLKPSQSAKVYDADTKELIMFVLADVIAAPHILSWMTEVIERGCAALRSVRLSDPGKLVVCGYSSGSRNEACLGWSSTLATGDMAKVFRKKATGELDRFNCDISNVFSLTWNIFKKIAPEEVLQDYSNTVKLYDLPPMDGNGRQKKFFEIPGLSGPTEVHRQYLADMAPVGGLVAKNYVRYVHTETNLTKYMNSFTTFRGQDSSKGGHFYNCRYGIRVQGGANRWVTWKPTDAHGTSLQDVDYSDPNPTDFKQVGLGTSLSNRLPAAIFGAYMKMIWEEDEEED